MKNISKFLITLMAVTLMVTGTGLVAQQEVSAAEEATVERLAGDDRVKTAVVVSKKAYPTSADAVVLVGFNGEVDALTGTLLASAKDAPVLFTHKDKLSADTKAEIERLGAKDIYILGGLNAISADVQTEVNTLTGETAKRLGGDTRFETAIDIAGEVKTEADHAFVVLGMGIVPADALAVGPVSGMNQSPVLLTTTNALNVATKNALEAMGVTKVTIVGGESAVDAAVADAITALGITVDRVAGLTREATAEAVAAKYFPTAKGAIIANGYKAADALVGGYLGAKVKAPILLAQNKGLVQTTIDYIEENVEQAWILGGTAVVSAATATKVQTAVDYEEVEEFKVVSVSAISNNGVTVIFTKATEAKPALTVEVKDPSGKVHEVKPVDVAVGDTEVYFSFKTPIYGNLETGMWTVDGVNYDQAALYAAKAVRDANTQAELLTALQSSYFTDVKAENIVAYSNNKAGAELDTVSTIQKTLIDATNKEEIQNKTVKEIIETAEANNQIKLLSLLKASNYDRLIDANVAGTNGYLAKIDTALDSTDPTDYKAAKVQAEIDDSNLAIAKAAVLTVQGSVTRADYNKALAQVNNLTATSQKSDKTTEEAKLVIVDKLVKLTEAQTNSSFNAALTEVSKLSGYVTSGAEIFPVNNGEYKTKIQALAVGDRDEVSEISTAVKAVNIAESGKMFTADKLAEVKAYVVTDSADIVKFDNWLKAVDARVPNATFDYTKNVKADMLKAYLTAVKADSTLKATATPVTGLVNAASLSTIVTTANTSALTTAIGVVTAIGDDPSSSNAADLLAALQDKDLGLKNVKAANAVAYFNEAAELSNTKINGADSPAKKVQIQKVVDLINGLVTFNSATTSSQAAEGLALIAIVTPTTDYTDLNTVAKANVAQLMMDVKPTAGFANVAALTKEFSGTATSGTFNGTKNAIEFYKEVLKAVNDNGPKKSGGASISGLVAAISSMDYDAFKDLGALEKTKVAESIINNWEMTTADTPVQVDFKSWSAVRTAVDTAIAAQ